MSEIIDFYQHEVSRHPFSQIMELSQLQAQGLNDFIRMGFPTRADEDWKYTNIDNFLKQSFSAFLNSSAAPRENSDLPIGHSLSIVDGFCTNLDTIKAFLPADVIIQPLAQAVSQHADKVKPYLGQILQHEHGFHALNTAMLGQGLFIYLPHGVTLSEPLILSHYQTMGNQAVYLRHLIVAEADSEASIIEDYQGVENAYFTNTLTEIALANNAHLTHYKIQRESNLAYHVGHIFVKQAERSQLDSHLFNLGGRLARSDMSIQLQERNARCLMNGIYVLNDNQHMDQHTLVNHDVPDCSSEQNYKGILMGHSRAVFNGKVVVAKGAIHTQAKQQNKNLLLSKLAEIDTKPQLDIYADDVVCSHGATVGQLDEDALFYLATRGIDREEASQYLIQAFVIENLRYISDVHLTTWLSSLLTDRITL